MSTIGGGGLSVADQKNLVVWVDCPQCLDSPDVRSSCDRCDRTGRVPAPWVEQVVAVLEGEGIARRTAVQPKPTPEDMDA